MGFFPYLAFNGTCARAMTFYAGVFGARDLQVMTYAEAPPGSMPEGTEPDAVMHAQFSHGDGTLMASDMPGGASGHPANGCVFHAAPDMARAAQIFEALTDGGQVQMPFGPVFWSPGFGMLRDRFGTDWMITVETAA